MRGALAERQKGMVINMLEIPEANTMARQLRETLKGKRIAAVQAAQSPHGFAWYFGEPAEYPAMLVGKKIENAVANGGQVEIFAGDMRINFNDGVNIRYLKKDDAQPKKHQLYIEFEEGDAIVCTVQMYGGMMAFPAGAHDNFYYQVSKEKPSPLSDEFDEGYFRNIVEAGGVKLSAKALLATEQRIPGLGNGCAQDILFRAGINPQSRLELLSDTELSALYRSVKDTLLEMTEAGGRSTEKDLFGKPGGYSVLLSAKTAVCPCPGCGGPITKKAYMGGNVYFCGHCQPVKK